MIKNFIKDLAAKAGIGIFKLQGRYYQDGFSLSTAIIFVLIPHSELPTH